MSDDLISRKAVIAAVDRHTREDGTLDDDISVILEEVKTAFDKEKVVKQIEDYRDLVPEWALKKYEDTELTPEQIMELKERDTAKEILHIHQEFSEHQWRRTAEGKIDEFAMYVDCHSGPVCERCGYSYCEHCEPNGWDEEPCVIDEYRCPTCNENIGRSDKYCKYCGQRLK